MGMCWYLPTASPVLSAVSRIILVAVSSSPRAGGAGAAERGDDVFGGDAVLVAGVQAQDLGAVLDRQGDGLAVRADHAVEPLHQQTGAPCCVVHDVGADHREVGGGGAPDEVGLVLHHL